MKKFQSTFFSLIPKDFLKAAILAGITAGLQLVYEAINADSFPTDAATWKHIGMAAVGAAIAYVLKNLLTNSKDEFLKPEKKTDVQG